MAIVKYARFLSDNKVSYGIVEHNIIKEITGNPIIMENCHVTGKEFSLHQVKILAPNPNPTKMVCLALNYRSHIFGAKVPSHPEPFYKVPTSIIGPGETIRIPRDAGRVVCESELVAVIGKKTHNIPESQALSHVFGYTCGNDVSARDWQSGTEADIQWWRAKSCDTFAPTGPFIVSGIDPQDCTIRGLVNGVEGQKCHSSEMIFTVSAAISFISRYVTLNPTDMVWTGTSGTTPPILAGDTVSVEIDNVGTLINPVEWLPI